MCILMYVKTQDKTKERYQYVNADNESICRGKHLIMMRDNEYLYQKSFCMI